MNQILLELVAFGHIIHLSNSSQMKTSLSNTFIMQVSWSGKQNNYSTEYTLFNYVSFEKVVVFYLTNFNLRKLYVKFSLKSLDPIHRRIYGHSENDQFDSFTCM